jgi:hypothetical protein
MHPQLNINHIISPRRIAGALTRAEGGSSSMAPRSGSSGRGGAARSSQQPAAADAEATEFENDAAVFQSIAAALMEKLKDLPDSEPEPEGATAP